MVNRDSQNKTTLDKIELHRTNGLLLICVLAQRRHQGLFRDILGENLASIEFGHWEVSFVELLIGGELVLGRDHIDRDSGISCCLDP